MFYTPYSSVESTGGYQGLSMSEKRAMCLLGEWADVQTDPLHNEIYRT